MYEASNYPRLLFSLFDRIAGMKGSITINGQERNLNTYKKLSCYIMQDNQLHANLTVEEAMKVATNLKLEKSTSKSDKETMVSRFFLVN